MRSPSMTPNLAREIALEQAKGYRDTSKDVKVPKPFRDTARRLMREMAMEWRRPMGICIR